VDTINNCILLTIKVEYFLKTPIIEAINQLHKNINDINLMLLGRTNPTYFTRKCKLDFKTLILFMLNFITKSMQVEIDNFLELLEGGVVTITKQAISEARKKIKPETFVILANDITNLFYNKLNAFKTYKGYRVSAIDGSKLELNNSKRLRLGFGTSKNATIEIAKAMASMLYDVENDYIIASKIDNVNSSERNLAVQLIEQLKTFGQGKELILFDRGYPSKDMISYLEGSNIKFLMRVSSSFVNEVNKANQLDQIIEVKINKRDYKLRVIRFILPSGIEEKLISNLTDVNEFTTEELKTLYFKRWGVETKYNELKNKLQIENFTGDSVITVEQDFYATVLISNLLALSKAEANKVIKELNQEKVLKLEYKVNVNILISKLKNNLILAILEPDEEKRNLKIMRIIDKSSRYLVPVKKGRSFKRHKGLKENKFQLVQKRVL